MQHPKYFGTDGIRGCVGTSLITPEFVLKLGWAAGKVFADHHKNHAKVLIGKDTRISGYMLESALQAGLSAAGVDIQLLGPMPTPAIAYLTRTFRADAGIVISASHNLYHDNGIKFFSIQGTKISVLVEQAIEHELTLPMSTVPSSKLGKASRIEDAPGRYIEFCKSTVSNSLSLNGMKIVVDCAHGATYHIAPHVFKELGAKVLAIGTEPNGLNINERCGSTDPKALKRKVLAEEANLGIALDGDGDRLIMIDHKGEVIDGDELLFIMARAYKEQGLLAGGVVGTVMSNFGFEEAMKRLNIDFIRAQVGDRHVMEQLKNAKWLLGGEPSGHIVNLGLTTTGDGIVSALQILHIISETGRSLHELKKDMKKLPHILINVPVEHPLKVEKSATIKAAVTQIQKKLCNSGRVLLRASGTESLIRVMLEGRDPHNINTLANELAEVVKKHG